MKLYKIDNFNVLLVKGAAAQFLKGLTTNTLEAPFNAFVNQHGRIIATFCQQRISDQEFLMAVPASSVEPLLKHLTVYAKIGGAKIETTNQKVYLDLDSGEWLFKQEELPSQASEDEFTKYRLEHNLPLQGIDYQADEFILNVDSGQFVSFTKGCFLGQEPVAKVHNRSKPSKKLIAQENAFVFVSN